MSRGWGARGFKWLKHKTDPCERLHSFSQDFLISLQISFLNELTTVGQCSARISASTVGYLVLDACVMSCCCLSVKRDWGTSSVSLNEHPASEDCLGKILTACLFPLRLCVFEDATVSTITSASVVVVVNNCFAELKAHTDRTRFGNATRIFSFQWHLTLIFFNVFQIFGTT
jgi:hypothetical protein